MDEVVWFNMIQYTNLGVYLWNSPPIRGSCLNHVVSCCIYFYFYFILSCCTAAMMDMLARNWYQKTSHNYGCCCRAHPSLTLLRHQLHHVNQTDYLDIKPWASNLYRSKIGLQPVSFPCHSCCLRSWHLPVESNPWSHAMLAESILKHVATAANLRDKAHLRSSCQKFCKAAGPNGGRTQPGFPHRSVVDGLHMVALCFYFRH